MSKKTYTARFASALPAGEAPTVTAEQVANAEVVELVAFPVLPASPFTTQAHDARHGLQFTYNADALIAAVANRKRRIPLTIEHNDVKQAGDTRARGWIHRLFTSETEPEYGGEPGVLYAWVELNALGKQEYADKLYGYTSAVGAGHWLDENTLNITGLRSLTLTNDPAAEMPMAFTAEQEAEDEDAPAASATQENTPDEDSPEMLKAILAALGVAENADEAAVLSAIEALKTPAAPAPSGAEAALTTAGFTVADIGRLVRADALDAVKADVIALTAARDEALATVQALTAEVSTLKAAAETAALSALVDGYVRDRKITPAQRDQALALARTNMQAFSAFVDSAPALIDDAPLRAPAAPDGLNLTAEERAKAKAIGVSFEAYAAALEQTRSAQGI